MSVKFDLSHLTEAARGAALLSNAERIERIRRDRWIGYPRANDAVQRLTDLFNWPIKQRMPNVLIVGPTNNGKSMVIERFRRAHAPAAPSKGTDRENIPIVAMQMPSDPAIGRFYSMLLATIGAPVVRTNRTPDIEHRCLSLLRAVGTRILIIDELHNVLAGTPRVQREFLNLLRFLGNELRIPIVGVGTKEAYLATRSDDQLENRFEPLLLPAWEVGDDLRSLLSSFAASFPLRRRSALGSEEMARYIHARSDGTIGEMSKLLSIAAIKAIETGHEAIDSKTLQASGYASPSERRRAFERELA